MISFKRSRPVLFLHVTVFSHKTYYQNFQRRVSRLASTSVVRKHKTSKIQRSKGETTPHHNPVPHQGRSLQTQTQTQTCGGGGGGGRGGVGGGGMPAAAAARKDGEDVAEPPPTPPRPLPPPPPPPPPHACVCNCVCRSGPERGRCGAV